MLNKIRYRTPKIIKFNETDINQVIIQLNMKLKTGQVLEKASAWCYEVLFIRIFNLVRER